MDIKKAALAVLLLPVMMQAFAEEAGITPYRPTVSNPAQLSAPGQLELELGGLHTKSGDTRRTSIPYLLKLAFNEQWGLLMGGEALVNTRDDSGARSKGVGDTTFTLKHAFVLDDDTALGLELGAKLPTAKDTIGSGKSDYTINGIFSQDLGKVHLDANLNATRLGAISDGMSRMQSGLSASLSMPLSSQWSGTAELAGTHQNGAPGTAQFLAALVYSPSKQLAIDVGFAKGLNSASQDWSLFSGFVMPLGKFW